MKNEDAQLVNQFLTGNEEAFTTLVKKYQKSVHALAWRKVGDFHIAEELTQDTFLKAYQKLATLKNPNQFAGWLYVIADRVCIDWHRKRKPQMEYLESTTGEEIEASSYRQYEDEQRKEASVEHRRRHIRSLLEKLPESERTVVTLHYLGEMTYKAISEFLGVSPNTVKSRLQRARKRLKQEDDMVRETLGRVHLPTYFTENIIRQLIDIKPIPPTNSKPLIPVVLSAATAIFIFLIMGVGSQYLSRFQKPYNLNVQSETTVEIIDAPIVLDTQAKPDLRNQVGRFDTTGKSKSAGLQISEPVVPGAAQVEKETRPSTKQQWIQASGPEGGSISGLFVSASGDVYAASPIGMYRLAPDAAAWTLASSFGTTQSPEVIGDLWTPMAEHNDILYFLSTDKVLTSTDRGETWTKLAARPEGPTIGLAITDDAWYLALREKGIFRSTDAGKQWTPVNNEIADSIIMAVVAIENTVFVGTNKGLYRLHSGTWKKLSIDTQKAIHSLAVSENDLYVGTGPDISQLETPEGTGAYMGQILSSNAPPWKIFHSTDLGDVWTDITPTSNSFLMKISPGIKVLAAGKTLLGLGVMGKFRSIDGGKTWTEFGFDFNTSDTNSMMNAGTLSVFPAVVVDEHTFFKTGPFGLTRSTDGGKSWHSFMIGITGTRIQNLVAFKNGLYTNTWTGIAKSIDGGESWETLSTNSNPLTLKSTEKADTNNLLVFPKLTIFRDELYIIAPAFAEKNELRIFRLSANGSALVPIQDLPTFDGNSFISNIIDLLDSTDNLEKYPGAFAVSGDTFYVEYKRRLFRWTHGESEWFNTGLIDTSKNADESNGFMKGFHLAVSGETVYVGKRDGHLFQSLDGGNTWKDLTSSLPLHFERFNDIIFVGSTIYVATDAGALTSKDGEHWGTLTDKTGTHTIIDRIVGVGTTLYGAGNEGVYQLNRRSEWQKISPEVPDSVISLVSNNDRLYIATKQRGIFHISFEETDD